MTVLVVGDDATYDRVMGQRQYERMRSIHHNAGYREGLGGDDQQEEEDDDEVDLVDAERTARAADATAQEGFNAGFREGGARAFWRSFCRLLLSAILEGPSGNRDGIAAAAGRLDEALRRWERKTFGREPSEEEFHVVEQGMCELMRLAGFPESMCDPAQLAVLNPFTRS